MASESPVASPRPQHAEAKCPDLEFGGQSEALARVPAEQSRISTGPTCVGAGAVGERGASLTFDAMTLAIPIRHRGEPPSERYLLRDVSGVIQPGQMFALMGSRCGRPSAPWQSMRAEAPQVHRIVPVLAHGVGLTPTLPHTPPSYSAARARRRCLIAPVSGAARAD